MNWPDLLRAIATLAWPIGFFVALLVYKDDLKKAARSLIALRLKIGGNEAEIKFRESLEKLQEKAVEVEAEVVPAATIDNEAKPSGIATTAALAEVQEIERRVLERAASSPRIALIELSSDLDGFVRRLLAEIGLLDRNSDYDRNVRLDDAVRALGGRVSLSAASGVDLFRKVRNEIVHGGTGVSDEEILQAIDSGLIILRSLAVIPRESHYVTHVDIPLFSDEACTRPYGLAKGIRLRSVSPGGTHDRFQVFPTSKNWYAVGDRVTWEWELYGRTFGQGWYRDPTTGEVAGGWDSSGEFVGRVIR